MNSRIFRKSPTPSIDGDEMLTEAQKRELETQRSERARKNWGILRDHIRQMKNKVNFLVTTLDEVNEMKQQENINEFDVSDDKGGVQNDDSLERGGNKGQKKCL